MQEIHKLENGRCKAHGQQYHTTYWSKNWIIFGQKIAKIIRNAFVVNRLYVTSGNDKTELD